MLIASTGCNRASNLTKEVAYVNSPQVILRDRLAPIFEKKGTVFLGEKVFVLEHKPRFSRVRSVRGEEGWIADRYLVPGDTYDQFEKLATDNAKTPVQAHGTARSLLNLHMSPGRDTEHLFQLKEGDKVEVLKRATAEKPKSMQPAAKTKKTGSEKEDEPPPPALEDWLLIRGGQPQHVGWVLARIVDVDVPLEIAQYAEGQRIVGAYVLTHVTDSEANVPNHQVAVYVTALSPPKAGLPFDFDQIRVFTWSVKRHRYETGFRIHPIQGFLPVRVWTQPGANGNNEPVFSFQIPSSQNVAIDPDTGTTKLVNPRTIVYAMRDNLVRRIGPDLAPIPTTHLPGEKTKLGKAGKKKH